MTMLFQQKSHRDAMNGYPQIPVTMAIVLLVVSLSAEQALAFTLAPSVISPPHKVRVDCTQTSQVTPKFLISGWLGLDRRTRASPRIALPLSHLQMVSSGKGGSGDLLVSMPFCAACMLSVCSGALLKKHPRRTGRRTQKGPSKLCSALRRRPRSSGSNTSRPSCSSTRWSRTTRVNVFSPRRLAKARSAQ